MEVGKLREMKVVCQECGEKLREDEVEKMSGGMGRKEKKEKEKGNEKMFLEED